MHKRLDFKSSNLTFESLIFHANPSFETISTRSFINCSKYRFFYNQRRKLSLKCINLCLYFIMDQIKIFLEMNFYHVSIT